MAVIGAAGICWALPITIDWRGMCRADRGSGPWRFAAIGALSNSGCFEKRLVENHLGDGWLFLGAQLCCRAWRVALSDANKVQIRFEYRQISRKYGWNKARMKRE
jgi:hypothetical protein